ncbi:MAG: helix-turn-helix domain-containing protein [Treponema sp.]
MKFFRCILHITKRTSDTFATECSNYIIYRKRFTNLKLLRTSAGLSQSELAELSAIPVRTIQQYEQKRLCEILSVNS